VATVWLVEIVREVAGTGSLPVELATAATAKTAGERLLARLPDGHSRQRGEAIAARAVAFALVEWRLVAEESANQL
jgi:hypothetical protein